MVKFHQAKKNESSWLLEEQGQRRWCLGSGLPCEYMSPELILTSPEQLWLRFKKCTESTAESLLHRPGSGALISWCQKVIITILQMKKVKVQNTCSQNRLKITAWSGHWDLGLGGDQIPSSCAMPHREEAGGHQSASGWKGHCVDLAGFLN